jgi:hypothetical protein
MLGLWLLEGGPLEACAANYGVSPNAYAVHLLRAGRALAAQLGVPPEAPGDVAGMDEVAQARGVVRALEAARRATAGGPLPTDVPDGLHPLVSVLSQVAAQAGAIRAAQLAAEEAEAQSPRRQREEWLRRLAIAILVALTAYFLLR